MLRRFALYGILGWAIEVLFTGLASAVVERNPAATGRTYLWMHPIYGAGGLALEALQGRARRLPLAGRALLYTAAILGTEYSAGWLLCRGVGRCPWDYGERGYSVRGLVRLDYLPLWFGLALLFEPVHAMAGRLTARRRR